MTRSRSNLPANPPERLPPPELVEDARGLERLLAVLAAEKEVAVDTEADSFYHYQESVCLVQISAGERDWLVDPLRGLDLAPLGALLADPARAKVFHVGEYDVLILKRQYGFRFANLFDTRVASAALGVEAPGLAAVVAERFGVELDKSQQRSDWSRRPLTPAQIAYARLDTRYLLPLRAQLVRELEERGRTRIVEGECRRLAELQPTERSFHPDDFLRIKGARRLGLSEMRALREIFVLREHFARERDVPPFKVLAPAAMLALAQSQPGSLRALERVPGLPPSVIRRIGHDLVAALARARELGPLQRIPSTPARNENHDLDVVESELHERLKTWRKERALREKIDSSLVLNRHVLERLARERPKSRAGLEKAGLLPWQLELFGQELVEGIANFEKDLAEGKIEFRRRFRR